MKRDTSIQGIIGEAIRAALVETHTALPGRIESYDPATQTATVAIELQREFLNEDGSLEDVTIPPVEGVPVLLPRAGGFSISFPVQAGDKCLLVFAERDISGWLQSGEEGLPPSARKHFFSDAVAILGLWPSTDPITPPPSSTALQIRSDDGTTSIEISATGGITLTRNGVELLQVLSTALNLIATTTVSGSIPLDNAAAITAQQVLLDAIRL